MPHIQNIVPEIQVSAQMCIINEFTPFFNSTSWSVQNKSHAASAFTGTNGNFGKMMNISLPQTYSHLHRALFNKRSVQAVAEAAVLCRGPWHVELRKPGPWKPERVGSAHRSSHYWQGALAH